MSGVRISLAGRILRPVREWTLAQDHVLETVLTRANVVATLQALPESTDPAERFRVALRTLTLHDDANLFLCCLLQEVEQPWSKRWAQEMAAALNATTSEQDRALASALLVEALARFFADGSSSRERWARSFANAAPTTMRGRSRALT